MKYCRTSLLISFCLWLSGPQAQAQMRPEAFDSLSVKMDAGRLQLYVDDQLARWDEALNRRGVMDPLKLEASVATDAPEEYVAPYRESGRTVDSLIGDYAGSLFVRQEELIDHKRSALTLLPLKETPGIMGGLDMLCYVAHKAYLKNGAVLELHDTVSDRGSITLPTTEVVTDLTLAVHYTRFADIRKLQLDEAHPVQESGACRAELIALQGNKVLLECSDSLFLNHLKIAGLNAAGKSLLPYEYSSVRDYAAQTPAQLEKGLMALRQVQLNLKAGLYTSVEDARQAIRSALEAGAATVSGKVYYRMAYSFKGTPARIVIYYQSGHLPVTQQLVLRCSGKKIQQEDDPIDIRNR